MKYPDLVTVRVFVSESTKKGATQQRFSSYRPFCCTMFPSIVTSRNACRAASAVAVRQYSRSVALNAEPVLHNATGKWEELKSKRPIDHDDLHVSFPFQFREEIPHSIGL
jgi:hypothetical protein